MLNLDTHILLHALHGRLEPCDRYTSDHTASSFPLGSLK